MRTSRLGIVALCSALGASAALAQLPLAGTVAPVPPPPVTPIVETATGTLKATLPAAGAVPNPPPVLKTVGAPPIVQSTSQTVLKTVQPVLGKATPSALPLGTGAPLPTVQAGSPSPAPRSVLGSPSPRPANGTASVQSGPQRQSRSLPRTYGLGLAVAPAAPPASAATLARARSERLQTLIRDHSAELDADELGQPIVRGQLVLLDVDARTLGRLAKAGFQPLSSEQDPWLGLRMTVVRAPPKLSTRAALGRLRAIAPRLGADYNHLFEPAGGTLAPAMAAPAAAGAASGPLIAMIDGGVAGHPSLAGRIAEQRGFAGPLKPTGHGTAVASLLVGRHGKFRGAASNARLLVADVYGGRAAAGSATAITRAMIWLAGRRPEVVNISLVGPRNELVRRAVAALRTRGIEIVAAVGNDGPAAPPQYPASYPGVVTVTGVDGRGVALLEAGNAVDLDFAAPGSDMAAARIGGGYARVRGTSFAAPLAAGRLAYVHSVDRLAAEARPGKGRIGRGIVCADCRVTPEKVGAR